MGNHPALKVSPGPPAWALKEIRQRGPAKWNLFLFLKFVFVRLCARVYLLQFGTPCPELLETKDSEKQRGEDTEQGGPGGGAKGIRTKMPGRVFSVRQECCWRLALAKVLPAGPTLQGGPLGATELVRGPQGCSSSVAMWQRFKGWSPLSSGKYLIKFFSLFFFPLLHVAPDRIWVWGQHARRTQRKKRNVKGRDSEGGGVLMAEER